MSYLINFPRRLIKKKEITRSHFVIIADSPFSTMLEQVIKETHKTFVDCFHIFYPTAQLKWTILCDLLDQVQKVTTTSLTLFLG